MKKRVMIVLGKEQFGYHTDTLNYSYFLKNKYDITVITRDYKLKKIILDNINVKYIPDVKIRLLSGVLRIIYIIVFVLNINPDFIFITEFQGASIIKRIFKNINMCLDIRTSKISDDKSLRDYYNTKIKKETYYFEHITIISEGVRALLDIPKNKTFILPLGAKTIIDIEENRSIANDGKLSLLYVGSFEYRRVEDTINAFNKLSENYKGKNLSYTLIGFFKDDEQKAYIQSLINSNKYNNIRYIGRVVNEELGYYFNECNIGVSYIPITEYYNYQPPTKTYEYLFNGLFTIATKTEENKKIINENNGILINDSSEEFYEALEYLYNNKLDISRISIVNTVKVYDWENISEGLSHYIDNIIECSKEK